MKNLGIKITKSNSRGILCGTPFCMTLWCVRKRERIVHHSIRVNKYVPKSKLKSFQSGKCSYHASQDRRCRRDLEALGFQLLEIHFALHIRISSARKIDLKWFLINEQIGNCYIPHQHLFFWFKTESQTTYYWRITLDHPTS